MMTGAAFILTGYLIGSLSFAILVSRLMGLPSPHSYGSGNPGATNVLRSGNKTAAILTLLGDVGKGWIAVFIAKQVAWHFGVNDAVIAGVALAVFIGHLYPIYFGLRGGKGVATAGGILLALDWRLGIGTLATWLIIAFFFRYSSLAALVSAVFAPFFTALVLGVDAYVAATVAIGALLVWRHRGNIRNLMAGTESRIGEKKKPATAGASDLNERG